MPLSCAPGGAGLTNCGAASESCCTSLEVPPGTFYRGYTNTGGGATGTTDPATISGFRLDKYEVTVGRFRQFVAAWNNGSGYLPAVGTGKHIHLNGGNGLNATGGGFESGWIAAYDQVDPTAANLANAPYGGTWTSTPGANEQLPITNVNWFEAYAFCIWDGGFLPSDAEWEYAAAGGSEQREFAWGSTAPGSSTQYAIYDCNYPPGVNTNCVNGAEVSDIAPVGTAPLGAGKWGQLDLTGNVQEWNLDWYATFVDPCVDCANVSTGTDRVNRGQGFDESETMGLWVVVRNGNATPATREGFRCARTP